MSLLVLVLCACLVGVLAGVVLGRPWKVGRSRSTIAKPARTWVDEVRDLYARSDDMSSDELDRLLHAAVRGERPDHAELPAYVGGAPPYARRAEPTFAGSGVVLHDPLSIADTGVTMRQLSEALAAAFAVPPPFVAPSGRTPIQRAWDAHNIAAIAKERELAGKPVALPPGWELRHLPMSAERVGIEPTEPSGPLG